MYKYGKIRFKTKLDERLRFLVDEKETGGTFLRGLN